MGSIKIFIGLMAALSYAWSSLIRRVEDFKDVVSACDCRHDLYDYPSKVVSFDLALLCAHARMHTT